MKIITWNVNGIRAINQKGALNWVFEQEADIICLQEIKAKINQIPEELIFKENYESFWLSAERPGYSGVAVYSRVNSLKVNYGMGIETFDTEGRIIQIEYPGFILYNIYFPNGQRGHERVAYKLKFYEELLKILKEQQNNGKNLVITGDFNTAHQEIDLANPSENTNTSGFLLEERTWITNYLNNGFIDIYRELYPEKTQYTWWTYRFGARRRNIGWRIDYFLITEGLKDYVKDVIIHDQVQGSDHCPVEFVLDGM